MKLKAKTDFSWAHGGTVVQHYAAGDVIDTKDADLIAVARREGWAVAARGGAGAADDGTAAGDPDSGAAASDEPGQGDEPAAADDAGAPQG